METFNLEVNLAQDVTDSCCLLKNVIACRETTRETASSQAGFFLFCTKWVLFFLMLLKGDCVTAREESCHFYFEGKAQVTSLLLRLLF